MKATDRLAAYLADELSADDRAQLEVALVNDPELRRTLDALERADDALAELESPQPSAGFDTRLDAVVDAALRETLPAEGPAPAEARTPAEGQAFAAGTDELAARRRRPWALARTLGAAAAGLVLVVGTVAVVQQLGNGDVPVETGAGDVDLFADASDEPAAELDMPASDEAGPSPESAEGAETEVTSPSDAGFGLVDSGRNLDRADLVELLDNPALQTLSARRLDERRGMDHVARFTASLGSSGPDTGAAADPSEAPAAGADPPGVDEPGADDQQGPQTLDHTRDGGGDMAGPTSVEVGDVTRCLDHLLTDGVAAIPGYTELATVDDRDALVLGVVVLNPASGLFEDHQVWVVDPASCRVVDVIGDPR